MLTEAQRRNDARSLALQSSAAGTFAIAVRCPILCRTYGLAAASLSLLVLGLYFPALGFDFVNWDDPWYVINNPLIKSWHPANLYRIVSEVSVKNYAPLTTLSYLVDHTIWGLRPAGFHLTNVLLHALNAVLVYVLLRQLTNSRFIAWTTAALFAVHPVQIETVAWIASRKGLLSGAFILASLICWLRPQRTEKQEGLGIFFLAFALLSKAIAVVVPFVVLMYDMLVRRQTLAQALPRQIIPGLLSLLLLLVTMSAQVTEMGGVRGHMAFGKAQILAVDSVILWRYVGMLLCPTDLCVLYDPASTGIALQVLLASAAWLIVAVAVIRSRKTYPLVTFATVTSIVFLLPVLNLFPITTLMNDRYLYLPSIPFFAIATGGIFYFAHRFGRDGKGIQLSAGRIPVQTHSIFHTAATYSVSVAAIVAAAFLTSAHLPVWKDGMALWKHAYRHVGELPVVRIQLANSLHSEGRDAEAVRVLKSTIAHCSPDVADRERIARKLDDWQQ